MEGGGCDCGGYDEGSNSGGSDGGGDEMIVAAVLSVVCGCLCSAVRMCVYV